MARPPRHQLAAFEHVRIDLAVQQLLLLLPAGVTPAAAVPYVPALILAQAATMPGQTLAPRQLASVLVQQGTSLKARRCGQRVQRLSAAQSRTAGEATLHLAVLLGLREVALRTLPSTLDYL